MRNPGAPAVWVVSQILCKSVGEGRAPFGRRPAPAILCRSRHSAGLVAAVVMLAAGLALIGPAAGKGSDAAPDGPPAGRQRFGFVAMSSRWTERYDVEPLHAGWFVDFSLPACREAPEGMNPAFGIRIGDMTVPPALAAAVDNHPGAIWLVGNEADCVWQDDLLPAQYADIYGEVYDFIKDRDPSARVAAGNIVQATPVRLAWLDAVLAAYSAAHGGQAMPVDVWAIHNQILNERAGQWGAEIPPGMDPSLGLTRTVGQNDSLELFVEQLTAFRQWMADRGYGGLPLIITEFGVLMPDEYGFTPDKVNAFMSATFDYLQTAAGPLGDPTDGGRLVQRWAWYSLDDPPWDPVTQIGFNGNLFDPDTGQITEFGQHFGELTGGLAPLLYADLSPGAWGSLPGAVLPGPTGTLTVSWHVELRNNGTQVAGPFLTDLSYQGPEGGSVQQATGGLAPGAGQWLTFTLPGLPVGGYSLTGRVDAARQVAESIECNNGFGGGLGVPAARVTLPLATRAGRTRSSSGVRGVQFGGAAVAGNGPGLQTEAGGRVSYPTAGDADDPRFQEWLLPEPAGYPAHIVVEADDGTIWFTERDANQVAHFDPATGELEEFEVPTEDSRPWGLALDAAGGVWFTEATTATNKIARFDPESATFSEYDWAGAGAQPWDVGVEPTGIVWFTERAGNKIGRLDPATGDVTEYDVPAADAQPGGILVQYRSASLTYVWFTETAANTLGRLRWPSLQFTERVISSPGNSPQELTENYAGYPWFTESASSEIALFFISSVGDFIEYPTPTPQSEPYGIAIDADGQSVWFTERAANQIGHYTELFNEYPLPTPGSLPTGVAADAAGCAWYTAPGSGRFGRFCPVMRHVFLPMLVTRYPPAEPR